MAKPGDKIGPYTLVRKLGRGAFGVVWLAEKRTVLATTKVALKFPNDEDVDIEAVKQEASLWVQASGHPNVLTFIDADVYDGQVVIVSEYAPDGSLSKWLDAHGGRAPTIEAAVEVMLGVLAGLDHLHKRGIIHRDVKPDNILLQNETPRLADFGIARILKTTSKSTIATGTPAYMSPEAFDGKRNEQTDIWSVGVIFYQLLTGSLPFPQTDISSLLMAIVTKEPEPLPISIPEPIRKLVERALQKNPVERYASVGEMRKALRDAVKSFEESRNEAKPVLPPDFAELPTQVAQKASPAVSAGSASPEKVETAKGSEQPVQRGQPAQEEVLKYWAELERKEEEERQRRETEEAQRKAEIRRGREDEQERERSHVVDASKHPSTPVPPFSPTPILQPVPQSKRKAWIIISLSLAMLVGFILLIKYNSSRGRSNFYAASPSASGTPAYSTNSSTPTPYASQTSQPTSTPTPYPSPPSVAVRLRLLYQGASAYAVADDVEVTLRSSTQNFSQMTNSQGFVTFNGVPCDEEVEINYRSDAVDRKLLRVKRYLSCGTSSADLGIYSATFGERLGSTESDLDGPVLR